MLVPGSNLLNIALTRINPQTVTYYTYTGRSENSAGLYNSAYAAGVPIKGSVQAMSRDRYEAYGLDFQKNYIVAYLRINAVDIARDRAGDQLVFNGKRYQFTSVTDWFTQDGWVGLICVEIASAG